MNVFQVENRQLVNNLFEKLGKLYWSKRVHGPFIFISSSMENVFGMSVEDMLSRPFDFWQSFVFCDDLEHVLHQEKQLLLGNIVEFDFRVVHRKTKQIHYLNTKVIPEFDEYGVLTIISGLITDMTDKNEAERQVRKELALAKEVQKGVLSKDIDDDKIAIYGKYLPSMELGGDMYAWYKIDDHRYGIFVSDIMGKGVAAALVAMSIRSLLRGLITRIVDINIVISELNKHTVNLYSEHKEEGTPYYFTCFYSVVDTLNQTIEYVSCGHPTALLVNELEVMKLDSTSVPIGMLPNIVPVKKKIHYQNGMKLLICTDGLYELVNDRIDKGVTQFSQIVQSFMDGDPATLIEKSIHSVWDISNTARDDVTVVLANLK